MNTRKTATPAFRRLLRGGFLALALAMASGTLIAPAFADEWRHDRDDGARAHEWREHHDVARGYRWYAPGYAYDYGYVAPGHAPAPAYVPAVPFVNFGFSFR